jgi:hypothetical protein
MMPDSALFPVAGPSLRIGMLASSGMLLLGLIAFLFVGQFLLYPFTFYFVHRSRTSSYRPREPGDQSSQDPALESLFADVISGLEARGFELVGHFVGAGPEKLRFDLLLESGSGDIATLVSLSGLTVSIRYLEYGCRFTDGSELTTSNSPLPPGTFAPLPARMQLQFAGARDPLELYELYRAAIERYFPSLSRLRRTPEILRNELPQEFQRVFEHQVASGLMRRTGSPEEYAPTLRGAFHMVWLNAFPVLAIRRVLYHLRMRRLESQLRSRIGPA